MTSAQITTPPVGMPQQTRKRLLQHLMHRTHEVPWAVRCTETFGSAIERTVDELRSGDQPAESMRVFILEWIET